MSHLAEVGGKETCEQCSVTLPYDGLYWQLFPETSAVHWIFHTSSILSIGAGGTLIGNLEAFPFAFYLETFAKWPQMLPVMEFVETLLSSETSTSWNGLVWHIPPTLVRKLRPGHQRFLSITPYLFRPKLRSLFQSSLPLQHNLL